MGTTADKLQSILDSKKAIKAAIEAKGVSDVGDVLSAYPDKIASIQAGGGSGYTGHADAEGLKAIGWTDEDIEYYQTHGVNWNEEDDEYHKIPQDNIDLYGVLTIDNIQKYKDRIVYLPKLDTSGITDMNGKFQNCYSMVAVPMMDTSNVTNMAYMFYNCHSLVSIPLFDVSNSYHTDNMFGNCYSLIFVPSFNMSNVENANNMFTGCHSLIYVKFNSMNNIIRTWSMFNRCVSLIYVGLYNIRVTNSIFDYDCYSIRYLYLQGLKQSLNISDASLLTKESLLYIIENAAPTEPITITLSAYCYNKYSADPDVVAALEAQPNISLASE